MNRTLRILAFGAVGLHATALLPAADLLAQTVAPPPNTTISFQSFVNETILPALMLVSAPFIAWIASRIASWLKLQNDAAVRAALNQAMVYGIDFAKSRLKDASLSVDVHNETVAAAVQYVLDHTPEAAAHFGLTKESLAEKITARLQASQGLEIQSSLGTFGAKLGLVT